VLGISKFELAVCVFKGSGVTWGPQSHTYTSYNNIRNGLPMFLEINVHV
jgi:hypothetical protein